jgi:hypothetical protein
MTKVKWAKSPNKKQPKRTDFSAVIDEHEVFLEFFRERWCFSDKRYIETYSIIIDGKYVSLARGPICAKREALALIEKKAA